MSLSIFLLWLVSIPISIHSLPPPTDIHINCGASEELNEGGVKWMTDEGFITVGNKTTLSTPDLTPFLSSLRFFSDEKARKYCYVVPVTKGAKYIVRTTYYYGAYDGGKEPPLFDQIIDGSKWSTVNTSENYSKGLTSFYEIAVAAMGRKLSVCLARNKRTKSNPFISALEVVFMENSMYNSTDFTKYALSTVARGRFGFEGKIMSYPDDPFYRYWAAYSDNVNMAVTSHSNITATDFWNLPPARAFETALTQSRGKQLQIKWPAIYLPSASYYIALYFQDNRNPSPYSWRVFSITVDGKNFYKNLNVSTSGVAVFGTQWPLAGQTEIVLTPDEASPVGPVINAGEILQIVPLGGRTLARDAVSMEDIAKSFKNRPADWTGDPCLPPRHSWTGLVCSHGKNVRVVSMDLTGIGVSGTLSPSIANLTAVTDIWLGDNKLSGSIPNLSPLKYLASLHLENNELSGKIPITLGRLDSLRELFLQNNKFEGEVPPMLKSKKGLRIMV
ncbi:hypothetical protein MRB53_001179 [Persea americana]|uniref:Uncharacterized protein n=1 Tax=Persea americana TaxID=3435 RepID=A0ACC2MRX7_PERAE|nr:hypothetical protein MRB53_001179 [Persea americana]